MVATLDDKRQPEPRSGDASHLYTHLFRNRNTHRAAGLLPEPARSSTALSILGAAFRSWAVAPVSPFRARLMCTGQAVIAPARASAARRPRSHAPLTIRGFGPKSSQSTSGRVPSTGRGRVVATSAPRPAIIVGVEVHGRIVPAVAWGQWWTNTIVRRSPRCSCSPDHRASHLRP